MEEYEQLEEELSAHYETYLTHFRNLSYLESLKEEFSRSEDVKLRENGVTTISAMEDLHKITDVSLITFTQRFRCSKNKFLKNLIYILVASHGLLIYLIWVYFIYCPHLS